MTVIGSKAPDRKNIGNSIIRIMVVNPSVFSIMAPSVKPKPTKAKKVIIMKPIAKRKPATLIILKPNHVPRMRAIPSVASA